MNYPVTLTMLFFAVLFMVIALFTTHGPTLNGSGFAAIVFVLATFFAAWREHVAAERRR